MLNRSSQRYYLNAMGLPQWQLRDRADKTEIDGISYIPGAIGTVQEDKKVLLSERKNGSEQIKHSSQQLPQQSAQQLESELEQELELSPVIITTQNSNPVRQIEEEFVDSPISRQASPRQEKNNIAVQPDSVEQTIAPKCTEKLDALSQQISSCHLCSRRLSGQQSLKTQILKVSKQTPKTILLLVDEPSIIEYQQGHFLTEPYQFLLKAIFQAVNLEANIYISSVLKCLSGENYQPVEPDILKQELNHCSSFLKQELTLIQPDVIVTLGLIPVQTLIEDIGDDIILENLIGKAFEVKKSLMETKSIPIIPALHPAFLYRNPLFKAKALQNWITIAKIVEN